MSFPRIKIPKSVHPSEERLNQLNVQLKILKDDVENSKSAMKELKKIKAHLEGCIEHKKEEICEFTADAERKNVDVKNRKLEIIKRTEETLKLLEEERCKILVKEKKFRNPLQQEIGNYIQVLHQEQKWSCHEATWEQVENVHFHCFATLENAWLYQQRFQNSFMNKLHHQLLDSKEQYEAELEKTLSLPTPNPIELCEKLVREFLRDTLKEIKSLESSVLSICHSVVELQKKHKELEEHRLKILNQLLQMYDQFLKNSNSEHIKKLQL